MPITTQQIPAGWKVMHLNDFANIIMGQSPPSKAYNQTGEGLPFFQGKADFDSKNNRPKIRQWTTHTTKIAPQNSILFTVRAPVGDVILNNIESCIGRGLASIEAKDGGSNKFLFFYLQHIGEQFEKYAQGSTFTAINSTELKNYEINVPSLSEQTKIATILSKVDEEIEKVEQIIEQTEKLKKGLMQKLLTKGIGHTKFKKSELGKIPEEWEVVKLEDIATVERGKFSHRPRNDKRFYGGDIAFIQTGNIVNCNGKIKEYTQTLNEKGLSVSRKFDKGTIVLTIAANIGDTGILTFESCFPDSLVGINVGHEMNNEFLEYYLRTKKTHLNKISTQSAQKNINLEKLRPLLTVKPPKDEQQEIAEILNSLERKISNTKKLKLHLQKLKKGLMADLLSGKVRTLAN